MYILHLRFISVGLTMSQTAMLRSLLQVTIIPLQNLNLKLTISGQVAGTAGRLRGLVGGAPAVRANRCQYTYRTRADLSLYGTGMLIAGRTVSWNPPLRCGTSPEMKDGLAVVNEGVHHLAGLNVPDTHCAVAGPGDDHLE
jgi:hypothetical protein